MTDLPLPEPVAWCKEWDGDVSDLGNMMVEFNRDDIDNIAEWVGLVTIDQLHAYAAAKTAELQAECARLRESRDAYKHDADALLKILQSLGLMKSIKADAALRGKETK